MSDSTTAVRGVRRPDASFPLAGVFERPGAPFDRADPPRGRGPPASVPGIPPADADASNPAPIQNAPGGLRRRPKLLRGGDGSRAGPRSSASPGPPGASESSSSESPLPDSGARRFPATKAAAAILFLTSAAARLDAAGAESNRAAWRASFSASRLRRFPGFAIPARTAPILFPSSSESLSTLIRPMPLHLTPHNAQGLK